MAFAFGSSTPAPGANPFGQSGSAFGASTPAFGAASTPAFGAASTPAFGAASTPAFGAASTPAFGAASTPAFGAASTPAFGAVSTPAFGAVSTPAFGAASTPAFGAASTPAFGAASTPAFGSSFQTGGTLFGGQAGTQQPTSFNQSSLQSFSAFGSKPQAQQQPSFAPQLVTKDNRPIAHSTKWEDLSTQAQTFLLDLEKTINACKKESKQLEDQILHDSSANVSAEIDKTANTISQNMLALSIREGVDDQDIESLRKDAIHLVRHTEAAVYSYKRSLAWRNATKASSSMQSIEELGPPMSLPYPYLSETVENLKGKLKSQILAVSELEITIKEKSKSKMSSRESTGADASISDIRSSITNIHDCLIRVAAHLQFLDDKVLASKSAILKDLLSRGDSSDPFKNAEVEERRYRSSEAASAMKAYNELNPPQGSQQEQQQRQQQQQQQSSLLLPAPSPNPGGGLFGTTLTPLFGPK